MGGSSRHPRSSLKITQLSRCTRSAHHPLRAFPPPTHPPPTISLLRCPQPLPLPLAVYEASSPPSLLVLSPLPPYLIIHLHPLTPQEGLNVAYLKNVTVAFLLAIYGDAEDDEHIRLARVLATILRLSPDEVARLNARIAEYTDSWWHRTSNLLKTDAHGSGAAGSFTGAITESFTAWPTAISEWFWGPTTLPTTLPAAAASTARMA